MSENYRCKIIHVIYHEIYMKNNNSFFCVLGVTHSCDLRHNQLSRRKFSSLLQCAQFVCIFQINCLYKSCQRVSCRVSYSGYFACYDQLLRLFFRVAVMVVYIEIQGKYPHTLSNCLYCNLLALWLVRCTWCFRHGVELHLFLRPRGWASLFSSSHSGKYFYTASSGLVCWGV